MFKGLNKPDVFKLFSIIEEISDPISFLLINFSKLFLDLSSIDKGETARGKGLRLPLVISTSIKPNDFIGINKINKKDIKKILICFIIYPSNISLASKFNCNSFHLSYPVLGTLNGWHSFTALKALSANTL